MVKYCRPCDKEFDCTEKNCPVCGTKLEPQYTEQELEEVQKQNDDFTVINTLLM